LAQTSLVTPHTLNLPVAEQVRDCMQQLNSLLSEYEVEIGDAVFVHLYLSSISLFTIVNEEYCKWFGRHPPSRSCVAVRIFFSSTAIDCRS
jgi:enamine deaminase RidA (YjgF/YER057c/UK114 family)